MRIAFTGKKLSGKSEGCRAIIRAFPDKNFITLDFMEKARRAAIALMRSLGLKHIPIEHFYDTKTPESRALLQSIGSYARSLDREVFIKHALEKIDMVRPDVEMNFLLENMRMKNEEQIFRERGFKIIRVVRPELDTSDNHITEIEMDSIEPDYIIYNEKTLPEYHSDVIAVVRGLYETD